MSEIDWGWKFRSDTCHYCTVMDRGPVCGKTKVDLGGVKLCPAHDRAEIDQLQRRRAA